MTNDKMTKECRSTKFEILKRGKRCSWTHFRQMLLKIKWSSFASCQRGYGLPINCVFAQFNSLGRFRSHPKSLFRRVNRFSSRAFSVIRDSSFFRHFVIRISSFFGDGFVEIQQNPGHDRVSRQLRRRRVRRQLRWLLVFAGGELERIHPALRDALFLLVQQREQFFALVARGRTAQSAAESVVDAL